MEYSIDLSGVMSDRLRALFDEATTWSQQSELFMALVHLRQEIMNAPYNVGERQYHTPSGIPVFLKVQGPLSINFAIHRPTRTVWLIKADRLLAEHEKLPPDTEAG